MTADALRVPRRARRTRRGLGWPVEGLALLAGLTLGLPVIVLVGRAIFDGPLLESTALRVVTTALALSLVTTAVSLVVTVILGIAARAAARPTKVPRLERPRDVHRPADRAAAVGRRAGPLLLAGPARAPRRVAPRVRDRDRVHHDRGRSWPRRSSSAPFFIRSARTGFAVRGPRPRGRRARRRRVRAPGVPVDHRAARVGRPSPPAW